MTEIHLCGKKIIARTFGVSRSTIAKWRKLGAPIFVVGKKFQANYSNLWSWIEAQKTKNHDP